MEEINKSFKENSRKNNQTGKANCLRLEDWNRGNKENTNRRNYGYGKSE